MRNKFLAPGHGVRTNTFDSRELEQEDIRNIAKREYSHWMLLIIGIMGTFYLAATPPFEVPDEPAHFLRAHGLAEGQAVLRDHPEELVNFLLGEMGKRHDLSVIPLFADLSESVAGQQRVPSIAFNSSLYSPVPYLFYASGIKAYMLLGGDRHNYMFMLFLCRGISLAFLILVLAFVFKKSPSLTGPVFWITATPMALFMSSAVNIDVFVIGSVLMISALSIARLEGRNFFLLTGAMFMLVMTKTPYGPLLLIPLISFYLYPEQKRWPFFLSLVLCALGVLLWNWQVSVSEAYSASLYIIHRYHSDLVEPGAQLYFVLKNPAHFANVVVNTLIDDGSVLFHQFTGVFGWLKIHLPLLPVVVWGLLAVTTLIGQVNTKGAREKKMIVSGFLLLLAILSILAVMLSLYMIWMPVASEKIHLQGRYFHAPVFVLLAGLGLLFSFSWLESFRKPATMLLIIYAVLLNFMGIYQIVSYYS